MTLCKKYQKRNTMYSEQLSNQKLKDIIADYGENLINQEGYVYPVESMKKFEDALWITYLEGIKIDIHVVNMCSFQTLNSSNVITIEPFETLFPIRYLQNSYEASHLAVKDTEIKINIIEGYEQSLQVRNAVNRLLFFQYFRETGKKVISWERVDQFFLLGKTLLKGAQKTFVGNFLSFQISKYYSVKHKKKDDNKLFSFQALKQGKYLKRKPLYRIAASCPTCLSKTHTTMAELEDLYKIERIGKQGKKEIFLTYKCNHQGTEYFAKKPAFRIKLSQYLPQDCSDFEVIMFFINNWSLLCK